jgi:hypothetical protein
MSNNSSSNKDGSKIMLGFIVRRCARELGHPPTPDEFAAWANNQEEDGHRYSLFGREISTSAAEVMLRHLGRLVTVRSDSIVKKSRVDIGQDRKNYRSVKR